MGSTRSEASTPPSFFQSVLLDHSYGKVAGVEEISMVLKVEQTDSGEGGGGCEEHKMEDPVEVFLKVPKEEFCDESMENEEDMLKESMDHEEGMTWDYTGLGVSHEALEGAAGCEQHPAGDSPSKPECPEENCGRKFKTKGNLNRHIRLVHSNEFNHHCGECCAKFGQKERLLAHYRSQYGHEKLICPEDNCGRKLTTKGDLNRHIKVVHRKEFEHQCEECGAKFGQKTNLLAHYRSQHGHEKLKCPENNCNYEFTVKEQLQAHFRSKHGQSKLKEVVRNLRQKLATMRAASPVQGAKL